MRLHTEQHRLHTGVEAATENSGYTRSSSGYTKPSGGYRAAATVGEQSKPAAMRGYKQLHRVTMVMGWHWAMDLPHRPNKAVRNCLMRRYWPGVYQVASVKSNRIARN